MLLKKNAKMDAKFVNIAQLESVLIVKNMFVVAAVFNESNFLFKGYRRNETYSHSLSIRINLAVYQQITKR